MSTYLTDASINSGNLTQSEIHLYGSSRLGIYTIKTNVQSVNNPNAIVTFERANKFFELSNHLGNVLVTVSDKKIGHDAGNGTIDYYTADVITANDFYPGGMTMPGRKYSAGNGYRYKFNGKEQDLETTGTTTYDYGFRIYSPALGRFLSVDPLQKNYPYYTPYQFSGNTPIQAVDLDGREPKRPKMLTNDLGWFKPVIGHWNYMALLPSERSSSGYELQNMGSSKGVVWEYEYIAWTGTQTYPHTQDMVWIMFNGTFYNATGLNSVSPSDLEGKETWEQYWGKQQMLQNSLNDISERAATAVAIVQLASGFKNLYSAWKASSIRRMTKGMSNQINPGQQGKHIAGHNNYKNLKSQGKNPSVLTEDAQGLLDDVLKGNILDIKMAGDKRRVDFGKVIGKYVDEKTGDAIETTIGLISDGKKGAHIVPGRPK